MDQSSFIQSISSINCDLIHRTEPLTGDGAFCLVRNVANHVLINGACEKSRELIEILENFIIYPDVRYLLLRALSVLIKREKNKLEEKGSEDWVTGVFDLLKLVKLEVPGGQKITSKRRKVLGEFEVLFKKSDDSGPLLSQKNLIYETQADLFAFTWYEYLSFKLPPRTFRNVLRILDSKVIPHFKNPLLLGDFLLKSFNLGGSASILALSSLYILITKCNLEYPEFYKKFYSLITPDMLFVKDRPRFFYWTDIFLTSTHIPGYLVAAFVKKLARLTLTAPVDAITILIPLIKNALIRHPSLIVLMNKNGKTLENDPYDITASDPVDSNAMESSLWELSTLRSHWNSKIGSAASFIKHPLPSVEEDLSELLETTFADIQEQAFKALDKKDYDMHIDLDSRKILRRFVSV